MLTACTVGVFLINDETAFDSLEQQAGAAGDGTVEVDLSGLQEQGRTEIHAIRYAWPLGDDGDTCWCVSCVAVQVHLTSPRYKASIGRRLPVARW